MADRPRASLGVLILEATLGGVFWCRLDILQGGGDMCPAGAGSAGPARFVITQFAFVHMLLRRSHRLRG